VFEEVVRIGAKPIVGDEVASAQHLPRHKLATTPVGQDALHPLDEAIARSVTLGFGALDGRARRNIVLALAIIIVC
jgi:hypothetical protein